MSAIWISFNVVMCVGVLVMCVYIIYQIIEVLFNENERKWKSEK